MPRLDPGFSARRPHLWALVALAAVLALAAACAEPAPPDAVARVGESWVSTGSFEIYLERTVGEDAADLSSEVLSVQEQVP